MKFIIYLNNFSLYRHLAYRVQQLIFHVCPKYEINRNYKARFHKKPNLDNPCNLIEKIYWMQIHCDTSSWTLLADKYRMREYVREKGFEDNLPKLYGVWENPGDISFNSLPEEYVLKANNGCGTVLVVSNPETIDKNKVVKSMKEWLSIPYGYRAYQPHYLGIKKCIIAEELLHQDSAFDQLSTSIVDFKVWCFNGKPECVFLTFDRKKGRHSVDLYDTEWNRMSDKLNFNGCFDYKESIFPKPDCLDEMQRIAAVLSKGQPEMRVDFYVVNNKPIIGELTMSAGYGNLTEEYYNYLGSLTDITLLDKIK